MNTGLVLELNQHILVSRVGVVDDPVDPALVVEGPHPDRGGALLGGAVLVLDRQAAALQDGRYVVPLVKVPRAGLAGIDDQIPNLDAIVL